MCFGIICDMFRTYVQIVSMYLVMCFVLYTPMTMFWYYIVPSSIIIKECFPMPQYHAQADVLHLTCFYQNRSMLLKT
jgi:hypothetical protein